MDFYDKFEPHLEDTEKLEESSRVLEPNERALLSDAASPYEEFGSSTDGDSPPCRLNPRSNHPMKSKRLANRQIQM